MAWSKIEKAPLVRSPRRECPSDLWHRCQSCHEIVYRRDFERNQNVCPQCGHHFPITPSRRIAHFLDSDSFVERDADLVSTDPLGFIDRQPYRDRLARLQERLEVNDALVCGEGQLLGFPVEVAIFDFRFLGGSMGSVVGEKLARTLHRALEGRRPAIVFSASGGARMQEGILSLMQMAKTCAALAQLRDARVPLISVLTHPTTGGVAASYAMLGDVNIAEHGALIGFAGPRVIKQTIGEDLPPGFQTAGYLLEHGMLDLICHRDELRNKVFQVLRLMFYDDALAQ